MVPCSAKIVTYDSGHALGTPLSRYASSVPLLSTMIVGISGIRHVCWKVGRRL